MDFFENKFFKSHGHSCELLKELDPVYNMLPQNTWKIRLERLLLHYITISEVSPMSLKYIPTQDEMRKSKKIHLKHRPYVIHPFSNLRKHWDVYMCILTTLALFLIPFHITSFLILPKEFDYIILTPFTYRASAVIMHISFALHILITLQTGFFDSKKKVLVLERSKIFLRYLRTYLIPDVLMAMQLHNYCFYALHPVKADINNIIKILQLSVIFLIRRQYQYMELVMSLCKFSNTVNRIIPLIYFTALYIHWYGAFTLLVLILQRDLLETTQENQFMTYYNVFSVWFTASFECVLVISGVGVGKFHYNNSLKGLHIFQWLLTKALFQYVIAKLYIVIVGKYNNSFKNNKMKLQLNVYMRDKNLPNHLRERLLRYYEFRYHNSFFKESVIMKAVSGRLKQDITMHKCKKLLDRVSFFKNIPISFLVRLLSCLQPEYYLTNDVIIKAKTTGRDMFFISTGTVAIYHPDGTEMCHLYDGNHFGEVALIIPEQVRSASVVAVEICKMFRLTRMDFLRAITPFPDLLCNIESIAAHRLDAVEGFTQRY